ncbi:MAG TPA: hypothetical protein DD675_00480, partial [Raoultella ornithinolytica]|nr:hypothetical protein [Raoultella ornithinolytica]
AEQNDESRYAGKRAYCLKTQPATGETYPKSDLFNKAENNINVLGVDGVKILDFYASGEKSKLFYIGDAAGKNGRGKREYIPLISQNIYIECNSQVDVNKLKMRVAFCENVIIKAPTIGTTIEKGDEISKLKTI